MILTANQKRQLRNLWRGEFTTEEIAEEMGVSLSRLEQMAAYMKLPKRGEIGIYLPTQQEIAEAAARIRAGWTRQERESRVAGVPRDRMTLAGGFHGRHGRAATDRDDKGAAADALARLGGRRGRGLGDEEPDIEE